jgi:hypothetical protein
VTECFAGTLQKGLLAVGEPESVRPNDPNAVGVYITQTLPEALQASECASRDLFVDPPVFLDTGSQSYHFPQAIYDDQLTVLVPRHDHVEAVRAEIDGREDVGDVTG